MFAKFAAVVKMPELRLTILLALVAVSVYRLGFYTPAPIVNEAQLQDLKHASINSPQ